MFNKDNYKVTIFGEGNNLYKKFHKKSNKIRIFIIVSIIIILFLIIVIILIRKFFFEKYRIRNDEIDTLMEENKN